MELTNEIIEQHGFKRINNSMFRQGELTLQNGYTHTKKAYKACFKGKFIAMIEDEQRLKHVVRMYCAL